MIPLAAALAFLKRIPWQVWLVLAVALTAWLWGNHRYNEGYAARTAEYEAAQIEAAKRTRAADEAADTQRTADNTRNTADDDARTNAAAAGGRTGANCERLRQAGYGEADLPEPCRR